MIKNIVKQVKDSIKTKEIFIKETKNLDLLCLVVKKIIDCCKKNKKFIIFGNGGSASDAQHFAAELVGRFKRDRRALNAIALSTNTSIITALGNDYSFDIIFSRQIEAVAQRGDVVFGISTSGNSENVIKGIKSAKKNRLCYDRFNGFIRWQDERFGKLLHLCTVRRYSKNTGVTHYNNSYNL